MLRAAVLDQLNHLLKDHLEGIGDLEPFLSAPPDAELGDLAFGCFGLAKAMRRSPAQIAGELAPRVKPGGLIASASASGPYLNFRADPSALLDATARAVASGGLLASARSAEPQRVMIEFSQPNTHKTFHVGHLRNVALGDSLVRIHRARGHTVIAANYYGDYGIDVAKCLWWLDTHPELEAPEQGRTAWLGAAYVAANQQLRVERGDDEATQAIKAERLGEVRQVLQAMEDHEPQVWASYEQTRRWCLDEFADTYRWLDVQFDVEFFESRVEGPANAIVDHYLQTGVFEVSEGAVVCRLEPDLDTPALVRKSDGSSLYLTWDLALAQQKFDQHDIERSLYVVGSEQRFHFQQLFLTLQRMGYPRAADCRHVAYELVMLPTGKMSSRDGSAIPLHELRTAVQDAIEAVIDKAEAEGRNRVPPEERAQTVHRIAVASLKYGMLSVGTNKRVIFDIGDWTTPEGDTGAYLLYSVARIRSILRKGAESVDLAAGTPPVATFGDAVEERELLNHLLKLPAAIERAEQGADPAVIAGWLSEGARTFSRFFNKCPVLQAEPDLRRARLVLIRATDLLMTSGLELLGITPVDAM